jgi:hypothetical protein
MKRFKTGGCRVLERAEHNQHIDIKQLIFGTALAIA